jgi:hypothetical protein
MSLAGRSQREVAKALGVAVSTLREGMKGRRFPALYGPENGFSRGHSLE